MHDESIGKPIALNRGLNFGRSVDVLPRKQSVEFYNINMKNKEIVIHENVGLVVFSNF